jgi:hypothetical protein
VAEGEPFESSLSKTHTRTGRIRPGYHFVPHDITNFNIDILIRFFSTTTIAKYSLGTCRPSGSIDTFQASHFGLLEFTLALVDTSIDRFQEHRYSVQDIGNKARQC